MIRWHKTRPGRACWLALLVLWGGARSAPADFSTLSAVMQRSLAWLTPVPFDYAASADVLQRMDPVLQTMLRLVARDDVLVVMRKDGAYTVFLVAGNNTLVPLLAPMAEQPARFAQLRAKHQRVWVMLVDPRGDWQMQPPELFAPQLAAEYVTIPLTFPVYCSIKEGVKGTTNYFIAQAALLEQVRRVSEAGLSPKFYMELGQIYRRYGDVTNALQTYESGALRFPDDPYLQRRTAELYFSDYHDYARAIDFNKKANMVHLSTFGIPMYEALFNSAMAYERRGEPAKAKVQYQDILALLNESPDPLWESRTRRYFGGLLLAIGHTNEALLHFQLDTRATVQSPAYSFNMVLDLSAATRQPQLYADTARMYFYMCGTNDARALVRYAEVVHAARVTAETRAVVTTAKQWMTRNPALSTQLRGTPAWWRSWTNIAIQTGLSPIP
ncbi:MAG: tetratricopeptide repeat protein [bacterium]|nr:tetratricopeptide repeat protein [bacterium]